MKIKFTSILWFALSVIAQAQPEKEKDAGLLWQITKPGSPDTAYLYGTMHVSDERVYQFSPYFESAWERSTHVALELNLSMENIMEIVPLLLMPDDYDILDHLDEKSYRRIDAALQKTMGQSLAVFKKLKPIFISLLLQRDGKQESDRYFLDQYLYQLALQEDKEVIGLETPAEQINAFDVLPIHRQWQLVLESINQKKSSKKATQKLLKAYLSQDMAKIHELMNSNIRDPEWYDALLIRRNYTMIDRMIPLIEGQRLLVAVGAGHLTGSQGMVMLLRERGYSVTSLR